MEPIRINPDEFKLENFINYYNDNVEELLSEYPNYVSRICLIDRDYMDVVIFDEDYEELEDASDYKKLLLNGEYALHFAIGKTYEGAEKVEFIDGKKYILNHYLDDIYEDNSTIKDIGELSLNVDNLIGLLFDFEEEDEEIVISVVDFEHGGGLSNPRIREVDDSGDIENILNPSSDAITFDDKQFEDSNILAKREVLEFIKLYNKEITLKDILDKFTQAPHGWKTLDIQGIIAILFKEQEIKIRHNGKYVNILDYKKLAKTLITSSEKESIMISQRAKVDAKLIKSVKEIAYELFDDIKLSDDEDLLASAIRESINNELKEIQMYIAKYEDKKYPGKSIFEKGKELFEEFKYDTDNVPFFKKLEKLEDDLLDWKDVVKTAKTFFINQKDKFDLGLRTINKYNNNKDEIQDSTLEQNVEKLQKILSDPMPYRKIKDIQDLVNAIDASINEAVDQKRKEAIEEIKEIQSSLLEKANEEGVTYTTKQTIEEFYQRHIEDIKGFTEIYRINSSRFSCNNRKTTDEMNIERDIVNFKKQQQEAEKGTIEQPGEVKETPTPTKKVERVKISKIVNKRLLLSENDVDEYIKSLELQLKKMIKEDKEIQIID